MGIAAAWAVFKASKAFRPVLGVLAVIVVLGLVYGLGRCSRKDNSDVAAQAEQTTRSNQATATAAQVAIGKIEDRRVTDDAIDVAVGQASTEINNAQNLDDIRAAVVRGVCSQPSHRLDPACVVH